MRMNWKVVALNLSEARDELQRLEAFVTDPKKRNHGEFLVGLAHVYHHLNFSWNARYVPSSRYRAMSDAEFNRWSRFPKDLPLMRLGKGGGAVSRERTPSNPRLERTGAQPAHHGRAAVGAGRSTAGR